MPEIAEVARIVHFLRKHLVGKQITKATAVEDANVFGKCGITGAAFATSVLGKKVLSADSQGKLFWILLDSPPHPMMHFGMAGWMEIRGIQTAYKSYGSKVDRGGPDLWPPRYSKFQLEAQDDGDKVELAFTDPRCFGRIRLIDCPADMIRQVSPLCANGPDPVIDTDTFTESFLSEAMNHHRVPIKTLLIDQTIISGIGNWVSDEVLFQARLHPGQYCDEFSDAQIKRLYKAICHVCRFAVDLLGDSDRFPDDWLFHYRWGKGTKNAVAQLPSSEKLSFLKINNRTSCYAPGLQKSTGHLPASIKEEPVISRTEVKKPKAKIAKETVASAASQKRKRSVRGKEPEPEPEPELEAPPKPKRQTVKQEQEMPQTRSRTSRQQHL